MFLNSDCIGLSIGLTDSYLLVILLIDYLFDCFCYICFHVYDKTDISARIAGGKPSVYLSMSRSYPNCIYTMTGDSACDD